MCSCACAAAMRACATNCHPLPHTATQHTATCCNTFPLKPLPQLLAYVPVPVLLLCVPVPHTATQCNTLQHTATNCSTLHHAATCCNTLQHSNIHLSCSGICACLRCCCVCLCRTVQHSATPCQTQATWCNTLQHSIAALICAFSCAAAVCDSAPHHTTPHHTTPLCNTVQHTATLKSMAPQLRYAHISCYAVATISRLLEIIGLFCKRAL